MINGKHRALIASDSRGSFSNGEFSDDVVKTFAAGRRTVLGIEGFLGLRDDPKLVVRGAAGLCAMKGLQDRPYALLKTLRNKISPLLTRVVHEKEHLLFGAIAFQKMSDGAANLFELAFRVEAVDGRLRMSKPTLKAVTESCNQRFAYSLGHGDCLTKGLEQRLDPDLLSDEAAIQHVDRIFTAAIAENSECRADIGFPIDICALDREGIRWLRRKPYYEFAKESMLKRLLARCVARL